MARAARCAPGPSSPRSVPAVGDVGGGEHDAAHGASVWQAVTALACKRDVTVIDITSSRMLMAYGFLRQHWLFAEHDGVFAVRRR
mgnify:CR=1 FL=1